MPRTSSIKSEDIPQKHRILSDFNMQFIRTRFLEYERLTRMCVPELSAF
jgi:hypothetical protein